MMKTLQWEVWFRRADGAERRAKQGGFTMPLKRYGVLKGSVVDERREDDPDSPHYQVHVRADSTSYRIAVNVKSQMSPSELLFLVDDRFRHPVTAGLPGLPHGFTELRPGTGSLALDFIRGNLFDRQRLQTIPHNLPGPDNDLSDWSSITSVGPKGSMAPRCVRLRRALGAGAGPA